MGSWISREYFHTLRLDARALNGIPDEAIDASILASSVYTRDRLSLYWDTGEVVDMATCPITIRRMVALKAAIDLLRKRGVNPKTDPSVEHLESELERDYGLATQGKLGLTLPARKLHSTGEAKKRIGMWKGWRL